MPKVGLLGHLKDENKLAQNDVMAGLGNTAQFSAGDKTVDNSRFRPLLQEGGIAFILHYQHGALWGWGSTCAKHVRLHVDVHVLVFSLMD